MPKKKVLVITYYWPPSGGSGVQRWVKFCKYLPEFDIEPIILTVENPTYPIIDTTLVNEVSNNTPVHTSKIFEPYSVFAKITGSSSKLVATPASAFDKNKGFIHSLGVWIRANFFIPDARIAWLFTAVKKAIEIIRTYDIDTIITTGPPNSTHLIGYLLKRKISSIKWVMDMRDPWSKIFFNSKIPRTWIANRIDTCLERKALSNADIVTVVSDGMVKLQSKIVNRKYNVVTNGFDHEDFAKKYSPSKEDTFCIRYVGSMTDSSIPYTFLESISKLPEVIKIKLCIEFYGSHNNLLKSTINKLGIDDLCTFNSYLPHMEAKLKMQSADLLLLVIPQTSDNELIVTGKIFDYIGAQVPIICIGPPLGDAVSIIRELNAGICFSYNDSSNLILWLTDTIQNRSFSIYKERQDFKAHPFSRYTLTQKMVSLILE